MASYPTVRTPTGGSRDINTTLGTKTTNRAVPTGTSDGDVMYAVVAYGNDVSGITVSMAQSGWTLLLDKAGNTSGYISVFRRIWHTGDPATFGMTVTRGGGGTLYTNWALYGFAGLDTTNPEDAALVYGTKSAGAATPVTSPTVNVASTTGVLLFGVWGGLPEAGGTYSAGADGTTALDVSSQYLRSFTKQQTANTVGANAGSLSYQSTTAQGASTQAVVLALRPVGAQQYQFGPSSATPASAPVAPGTHVISATTGLLTPVRPRDLLGRSSTHFLQGPCVLSRCKHYSNSYVVNQLNTRRRHIAMVDAYDLRFVYGNFYGIENAGPSVLTVTASIELPSSGGSSQGDGSQQPRTASQYYQVTWNGQTSVTIQPGQAIRSDPIPMRVRQGRVYFSNTYVTVPNGGTIVAQTGPAASVYELADNTTTADLTLTGAYTNNAAYGYSPIAIEGTPYGRVPVPFVGAIGDSIMQGVSRSQTWSWFDQVMELARVPHLNLAMSGEQAVQFGGGVGSITEDNGHRYRGRLLGGMTDIVSDYSINDLNSGATYQNMVDRTLGMSRLALTVGARFHQTTITPKTSSTDTWATANNQTPNLTTQEETDRLAFNSWLRDGCPVLLSSVTFGNTATAAATGSTGALYIRSGDPRHPITGVIDTCAAVAVINGSAAEVWSPNALTTDGLHPGDSGHNMIANAFATYIGTHFAAVA